MIGCLRKCGRQEAVLGIGNVADNLSDIKNGNENIVVTGMSYIIPVQQGICPAARPLVGLG